VLVGFIDDQFSLPAWVRLLTDSYSTLLITSGIRIEATFGTFIDPLLSMYSRYCGVGITNAINLMDGMDGLAGGQLYHRHEPVSGFQAASGV